MKVHGHRGYVQEIPSRGKFFAVCMREHGPWGPDRETREQAQADVDQHECDTGISVKLPGPHG